MNMLTQLKSMWEEHLAVINAVKQRNELGKTDNWPVHSASSLAGPKESLVWIQDISQVLVMPVIEPVQMEQASSIAFLPNLDKTPCFCVDYRKLNAVTIWYSRTW